MNQESESIADFLSLGDMVRIVLPPILGLVLFIGALFGILLPSYRTNLMDQQQKMVREMTEVAWQMIAVAERQAANGLVSEQQAKQIVLDHLRGMRYGDDNLDYFWVNDTHANMIMHPYRPDMEGRSLQDFSDPEGTHVFREIVRIANDQREGYLTYMWQWKNEPDRLEPKLSYIKAFEPWNWVVGTGMYLTDVNEKISRLSRNLIAISGVIVLLVAGFVAYMTLKVLKTSRQHREAEMALREHQDYLEKLVKQRTRNLTRTNQQLKDEIEIRKKLQEELFSASITDALTGLYNRRGFFELAEKQIQVAARDGSTLYLLYMDLDNMKQINDRFGHETGDHALREIAGVLMGFFRKSDISSRLGGDEFAILMNDPQGSLDEAQLVSRFQDYLDRANARSDSPYELQVSTGVAKCDPDSDCSLEHLLSRADELMYEHKRKSKERGSNSA